jgi:DNA-binding transcriptional MerR regulator
VGITIGDLSKASGVKVPTIRFYEQIGMFPVPVRTQSNRRMYDDQDVQRLRFIRHARALGFDLDSIRALQSMAAEPQSSCHNADSIARRHLADIDRRILQLTSLREELQRMVSECGGGRMSECRVIEILANHDLCQLGDHSER